MPGRHRGLSEMERSLLHRIQVIGQIIELVRTERTFDLAYSANGEWSIFAKKKKKQIGDKINENLNNGGGMMIVPLSIGKEGGH